MFSYRRTPPICVIVFLVILHCIDLGQPVGPLSDRIIASCPLLTQSGHRQPLSKCYASPVLCVRAGDGDEAAEIYQSYW